MPWTRITINLEPELAAVAKQRAKDRRQSVAAYFASLLEADIKSDQSYQQTLKVAEPPDDYGVPAPAHLNKKPIEAKKKRTA